MSYFFGAHEKKRFAQIYEENYKTVYNYVYRILLNQHQTEDIVSDTFMKALESFSRYNPTKGAVSTWLCGIAHNRVMDFFRSAAVRTNLSLEELLENGGFIEKADDWEENTPEEEAWEILRHLNVAERTLLSWRYFLELSNREIAQKLGITEKAASKRILKALAKCRKIAEDASTS